MALEMKDLYWLAGILEGEGSFCFVEPRPGHNGRPTVQIHMIDRDIIDRVGTLFGANVSTRKRRGSMRTDAHQVFLSGGKAIAWMMTLYTLMGLRRQRQIRTCIFHWKKLPSNFLDRRSAWVKDLNQASAQPESNVDLIDESKPLEEE